MCISVSGAIFFFERFMDAVVDSQVLGLMEKLVGAVLRLGVWVSGFRLSDRRS